MSSIFDKLLDGKGLSIVNEIFQQKIDQICLGVTSFNGRTGNVIPASGDYTADQVGALPFSFIASNAGAHNSIFRGKDLGTSVTEEQYLAISNGTFDDLFIGDYWRINNRTWRIAAFDYYFGAGSDNGKQHHAVIVPDTSGASYRRRMNETDTTIGGYIGSNFYKTHLSDCRSFISSCFPGHLLKHSYYLSSAVTDGKITSHTKVDQDVVLMTERNLYGANFRFSDNYFSYERGQFPLFALAPQFIRYDGSVGSSSGSYIYWLRDVATSNAFFAVSADGFMAGYNASVDGMIRPAFAIG